MEEDEPADESPVRAAAHKTPPGSPTRRSAPVNTLERVLLFQKSCLERDCHRCVASGAFHRHTVYDRIARDGYNHAVDDHGNSLANARFADLEVAYIIPYGLTKAHPSQRNKTTMAILDMLDLGIATLFTGPDNCQPANALTLSPDKHAELRKFNIYFQRVSNSILT